MSFEHLNTVSDWPEEPISLFREWYQQAEAEKVPEPEAMALAACTADGMPSVRIVLLRGFDERGFCFSPTTKAGRGKN